MVADVILARTSLYISERKSPTCQVRISIVDYTVSLLNLRGVASSLVLTADLGFDPAEHIIYEGVLSDLPVGHLQSGESREVETPLCFLSYGRFELAAEVRALDLSYAESRAGFGHLVVDVLETE